MIISPCRQFAVFLFAVSILHAQFFILNSTVRAASVQLPKTGQTASYAAKDDGALERGVAWPAQRFSDNGNGTVTDNLTGLIWLKNANCTDSAGGVDRSSGHLIWSNALTWSNNLSSGRCGLGDGSRPGDWRLPNVEELESLVDLERSNPALPAGHPFSNVQGGFYWSSSTYAGLTYLVWRVCMFTGILNPYVKSDQYYIWPVRSGQVGAFGSLGVSDASGNAIGPQVADTPFTIKVTGYSGSGAPITGWVSLSSFGGITPKDISLVNGVWDGQVILTEVAAQTSITASNSDGVTGSSNSFAVTGPGSGTGSISGAVMHNFDGPVSGAAVYLSASVDGTASHSTTTDSAGRYSFTTIPAGQYYLWAKDIATGKQCRRISRSVPEGRPVNDGDLVLDLYGGSDIPVVLVPGMLGSSARYGLQTHPRFSRSTYHDQDELHLHDPARQAGWRDLEEVLNKASIRTVECPWDWRMPIQRAVGQYLIPAIDRALEGNPTGKVNIIAHSMGGLLVRAYIQGSGYRDDIENFSMVGTPNLGSGNAYYMWEGGDPKKADDLTDGVVVDAWVNFYWSSTESLYEDVYGLGSLSTSDYSKIARFYHDKIPTARQLLPTYSFLRYNGSVQEIMADGNVNTFLKNLNNDASGKERMGRPDESGKVKTRVYYSSSEKTIGVLDVTMNSDSIWTALSPLYSDGRPKGDPVMSPASGDGTVLKGSATFPYTDGWAALPQYISGSHAGLIREDMNGEMKIIKDMYPNYGATSVSRLMAAAAEETGPTATVSISVVGRVQPVVVDSQGNKSGVDFATTTIVEEISGSEAHIGADVSSVTLNNLPNGTYTVSLKGTRAEDYRMEISYLDSTGASELHRLHGFNNATTTTFTVTTNSTAADRLVVSKAPQTPTALQADAVGTSSPVTRLSWQPVGWTALTGYAIYGRRADEPYMSRLGVTIRNTYDTNHPWATDDSVQGHLYAVSALKLDGTESFLTDQVANNDRDHDGLSDAEELAVGTDPTKVDTDADGFSDFVEQQYGSNPLAPTSLPKVSLTIAKAGTGGGSVSVTGGVTCGTACEQDFNLNSSATLVATPDSLSTLAGWTGCASLGANGACTVTMSGSKSITATFTLAPKARIGSFGYSFLADAYTAATATAEIWTLNDVLFGNVTLDQDKAITLKGGWNASYSARTGVTTLNGALTIKKGSLRVDGVHVW